MALKLLAGNGKRNREDQVLMINVNITDIDEDGIHYGNEPNWVPVGEDNDEITREFNDEVESKKNVLGKTNIDHSAGAETTEIDPYAIRGNDVLSAIFYNLYKYKLKGDKAVLQCMEVTLADEYTSGEGANATTSYGAFTENAIVQLNSWGGDTTKLSSPIILNWKGDRTHGTYDLDTNTFTPITSA